MTKVPAGIPAGTFSGSWVVALLLDDLGGDDAISLVRIRTPQEVLGDAER